MLNDKTRAEMDQALAGVAETIPTLLRTIYDGCLAQKFTDEQAFRITLETVRTVFSNKKPE